MTAGAWVRAFEAVRQQSRFDELKTLLDPKNGADANVSIEWDGAFLTPLFVAALLRLDDQLPQLLALGADANAQCLFEDLLCTPIHAAALHGCLATLHTLLDASCDANVMAETSAVDGAKSHYDGGFVGCNVLHALVIRDSFSEEVYRLLLDRGVKLSAPCTTRNGTVIPGLALPSRLGNQKATEERIDEVLGDEIKRMIRHCHGADELNNFLEVGSCLKIQNAKTAYRFVRDIDFDLDGTGKLTALLFAAQVGSSAAVRLLLYAGSDPTRTVPMTLKYDEQRNITVQATVMHIAALRGHEEMLEHLTFFGLSIGSVCSGDVCLADTTTLNEQWSDMTCMHLAVLNSSPRVVAPLLKYESDIDAPAICRNVCGDFEKVTPLLLAIRLGDVLCAAKLLDSGASVSESVREAAIGVEALREMFGGPPVVGFDDWLLALLTGEPALQRLLDRRTDLCRALKWPRNAAELLAKHRLAGPELVGRLESALTELTQLHGVRPVHLACMLGQTWAVPLLADAGASVASLPPCYESADSDDPRLGQSPSEIGNDLCSVPMDLAFLCTRVGCPQMLEFLCQEPSFGVNVKKEWPLVPDITPAFYPRTTEVGENVIVTWAWCRLSPLELAILHRRVDMALLLVRLGADMLHTTDHVAIRPPTHYSITEACFRGLTPLHLCAFLGNRTAAATLLSEACQDKVEVTSGEHKRPTRQALLSAVCTQVWATVETAGQPEREPWLWRDLTPLHLAIISKNYDVAELLIDASLPRSLEMTCFSRDVSGESERSFSALLLAYERNLKDLHRRIAKRFPSC
eukprot:TRINITY_DN48282_c0_g1_i1.p1 TRINITY_DN48282_c0_g1~~TRINITY_DN48282_c0_g1_i1.p1  ORF type:complete len:803 (+),score=120.19 TRINITY_DN48282_c0_g1_i1:122-2530(+)